MDNMRTFAVKSFPVAKKLISRGFELLNVTKDKYNKKSNCFIFEKTEKFIEAFNEIKRFNKQDDKLNDFEKSFIIEMLNYKMMELKKLGVKNTDTIDGIIEKLSVKKDDVDKVNLDDEVIIKPTKGSYRLLDDYPYKGLNLEFKQPEFDFRNLINR